MIMFVPVLAPIAVSYGIEPHHFGLIFVMAVQVALITPPVSLSLFVTADRRDSLSSRRSGDTRPFPWPHFGLTLAVALFAGSVDVAAQDARL